MLNSGHRVWKTKASTNSITDLIMSNNGSDEHNKETKRINGKNEIKLNMFLMHNMALLILFFTLQNEPTCKLIQAMSNPTQKTHNRNRR